MAAFSKSSKQKLETCHPDLQKVCNELIKHFDFAVIFGHRSKEDQDNAFAQGKSQLKWPQSKHNKFPSMAIDITPVEYKDGKAIIDWNDTRRIAFFAGQVMATARALGVQLRWGGDWDMDTELKDNNFNDLVHFELTNNIEELLKT